MKNSVIAPLILYILLFSALITFIMTWRKRHLARQGS